MPEFFVDNGSIPAPSFSGTYQKQTISDFSGGIIDNYRDAPPSYSEELDNLFITANKNLYTRPGSIVEDAASAPRIPLNFPIVGLSSYDRDTLLYFTPQRLYHRPSRAYVELKGPSNYIMFPSALVSNHVSLEVWKGHVLAASDSFDSPKKIFSDNSGNFKVVNMGLPALNGSPVFSGTTPSTPTVQYRYEFHYHYSYRVGNQTFQDFGPVSSHLVGRAAAPNATNITISNIPALSNGEKDSWDLTNIKIFIYRTVTGGNIPYKIAEITNGTTTFVDNKTDAQVEFGGIPSYRTQFLNNDPPPPCKYIHVADNTCYFANIQGTTEGVNHGQSLPYDIIQSVPGDPDSAPQQNRITVEDEIKGISSTKGTVVVLCENNIYSVDGKYSPDGTGIPVVKKIHDSAGCVSHNSIVKAGNLIYWCGNEGVYATDGFEVTLLSEHIKERYQKALRLLTDNESISGVLDDAEQRIYWGFRKGDIGNGLNSMLVLDLNFPPSSDKPYGTFTEITAGDSMQPTCLTFHRGNLYRGDFRGYVFYHAPNLFGDPIVDVTTQPNRWADQPVSWMYKSFATDFGAPELQKWISKVHVTATNRRHTTVNIKGIMDDGHDVKELYPIFFRGKFTWRDELFSWRSEAFQWRSTEGIFTGARRVPSPGHRANLFQVQLSSAEILLDESTDTTPVVISGNRAVLPAGKSWQRTNLGKKIYFEGDGYQKSFEVLSISGNTLTFSDPLGAASTSGNGWRVYGVPIGSGLNLLNVSCTYSPLGTVEVQKGSNV